MSSIWCAYSKRRREPSRANEADTHDLVNSEACCVFSPRLTNRLAAPELVLCILEELRPIASVEWTNTDTEQAHFPVAGMPHANKLRSVV